MAEIKCPKCGEVFAVDESLYAEILSQVKTTEFNKELDRRIAELQKENNVKIELEKEKSKNESEKEIATLKAEISNLKHDYAMAIAVSKHEIEHVKTKHEQELANLNNDLENVKKETQHAIEKAVSDKQQEIAELNNKILSNQQEYNFELKRKDEQIAYYKDLKLKLSTKMLGETLEQHCEIAFNQVRMTSYPNAYFEKDNDVKPGTKGDYIFREMTPDGAEMISIMFDMKNEADETDAKKKNEAHFKKLDEDRKKKGCEYAVLVSTLEPESEYYNAGIVDVSYRYPKMFVVRPQCFLAIIGLLYNAASNAAQYKNQLEVVKQQNYDLSNFEDKLLKFQDDFAKKNDRATSHYLTSIEEIDKTISHLQKVKSELEQFLKNFNSGNNLVQDLTIRKLTYGNPTVKALIEEAHDKKEESEEDSK